MFRFSQGSVSDQSRVNLKCTLHIVPFTIDCSLTMGDIVEEEDVPTVEKLLFDWIVSIALAGTNWKFEKPVCILYPGLRSNC